jgi:hypothetical protein
MSALLFLPAWQWQTQWRRIRILYRATASVTALVYASNATPRRVNGFLVMEHLAFSINIKITASLLRLELSGAREGPFVIVALGC